MRFRLGSGGTEEAWASVHRRRAMALLKWLVIAAIGSYAVVVAVLYFAQRALLYHPDVTRISPAAAGLPSAEEVVLDTSDGERVIAWHVPPRQGRPIVVYFHGNAEIVAWRVERHRALTSDGTGLLALSYRGYAGSTGQPTEEGLHRDAVAAYAFAAARYASERIVPWGHSLGSGVAVKLAVERPIGKLILEAPYTSTADVAAAMFPFVPVHLLMHDQFRSDERIAQVTVPVLVLHGTRDDVVPIAFGERLFTLVKSPKKFVRFADGGHIDLDAHGAIEAVRDFLAAPLE